MSLRLRDLIKAVRAAKTAAHERSIIQTESAIIRTEFSKGTSEHRQRNIAKLLYMSTLGYRTKWGQMECVKLIASHNYLDKRIGYLSINLLLDENQEILMLATHQIKTDIMHHHRFIASLAMVTLANVGSEQICTDCSPEIEQLLTRESLQPYLRKKAILCALKIVRKVPAISDQFNSSFKSLLESTDHGVLLATITLMIEYCGLKDFDYKAQFQEKYVGTIIRVLKSITKSGYTPEYDVGNISDPFLQIKILKLLRILGVDNVAVSEKLNVVLASIANTTDTVRNVGSSILYECVTTIMNIKSDSDLRAIAVNHLGKFLSNKDNNIRYVALSTLCQVVETDLEAVQKDRGKIVDCLKDTDRSIRRRALHLVYSLVDAVNVRNLVRELIAVLGKADVEFRSELTAKLCYVSEKYSPSPRWLVDTLFRVMSLSGEYVPEQVVNSLTATISRNDDLHAYSAQRLYFALSNDITQESLNQVAVWCIGEYGDLLVNQQIEETSGVVSAQDIINILIKVLNGIQTGISTKQLVLTALFKLSDRLGPESEESIKEIIGQYKNDINMELQQRACEYSSLWSAESSKRKILLARIPPLAVSVTQKDGLSGFSEDIPDATEQKQGGIVDLFGGPQTTSQTTNNAGSGSILDLFTPQQTQNNTGSVLDLFGGGVMNQFGNPMTSPLGSPMVDSSNLGVGNPLGNPMANPLGNPMANPLGSPLGNPMASPLGSPLGNPLGNPMASPLGSPLGNPMASPLGNPLGNPMASPLGNALGSPLGTPLGTPLGNPLGNPLGSPLGSPMVDNSNLLGGNFNLMGGNLMGTPITPITTGTNPTNNNGPLGDWFK